MDGLLALLFKYRPAVFDAGRIGFAPPLPVSWVVGFVTLVAIGAAVSYLRVRHRTLPQKATLAALRVAVLAILGFCLLRPQLILSTVVPQQNHVALLVDDSRSMRITDGGEPRAASAQRVLAPDGALLQALSDRFRVRQYAFSDAARRLDDVASLSFAGERTRLAPALDRARAELASLPVAGIVVVSDGGESDAAALAESLLALRAAGAPVYAVGVGREHVDRDIELSRAGAPAEVLQGATLATDLVVAQRGYAGERVDITVEDEGRIVARESIELPRDGEPLPVRVSFTAEQPGARRFTFRIAPRDDERIPENNVQDMLIHVRDAREKILYFEGEPRFEMKFLRRAVEEDENLQLVVLQRTAENRFMRLAVDSAGELAGIFPRTRDELFRYRALVLGSVEASFFTHDQLQMIADFASERGGGLLVLGGPRSLAEGGWAGTPVADVLPVTLPQQADASYFEEIAIRPTRDGAAHAVTRLVASADSAAAIWQRLPPLTLFNRVGRAKPGASVLLTGEGDDGDHIVLAAQRYGRGLSVVFTPHDSWLWQMHADVPVDDMSHETFWRQMLRWLVDGVPRQVIAAVEQDRVSAGEPVRLSAQVDDERYIGVNGAEVVARVTAPSGETSEVPLAWTIDRDGAYAASFAAGEEGLHRVDVVATIDGRTITGEPAWFRVAPGMGEYFDAGMHVDLLRRIAEETGGRYYTLDQVDQLPEDLAVAGHGATVVETRELWDMPILFLLMLGLVGAEWGMRRRWGLV
ncbi:MAG TPA: glutamine amidotransferase [Longimicrobiales bacterium]|nr:glutamine amidotransferase [Longimicrobiales bacterium]